MAHESDVDIGTLIQDKYRIIRELGSGATGKVYLAQHVALHSQVALKWMGAEFAAKPELRQRFVTEARALASVNSPHIVRILDVGTTEEQGLFLVMEYVPGVTLGAYLNEHGPLPPRLAATIGVQICQGLMDTHRHGFLHRDVKPGNVMLQWPTQKTQHVFDVHAKLADFGLAKQLTRSSSAPPVTMQSVPLGTPSYMPPEQIHDAAGVDQRADVFGVGAVLHEMLVGRPPFGGGAIGERMRRTLAEPPELPDSLPAALRALILKCLAKDADERFASAEELAEALRPCVYFPDAGGASPRSTAEPRASEDARNHGFEAKEKACADSPAAPLRPPVHEDAHVPEQPRPGQSVDRQSIQLPLRRSSRALPAAMLGLILVGGLALVPTVRERATLWTRDLAARVHPTLHHSPPVVVDVESLAPAAELTWYPVAAGLQSDTGEQSDISEEEARRKRTSTVLSNSPMVEPAPPADYPYRQQAPSPARDQDSAGATKPSGAKPSGAKPSGASPAFEEPVPGAAGKDQEEATQSSSQPPSSPQQSGEAQFLPEDSPAHEVETPSPSLEGLDEIVDKLE